MVTFSGWNWTSGNLPAPKKPVHQQGSALFHAHLWPSVEAMPSTRQNPIPRYVSRSSLRNALMGCWELKDSRNASIACNLSIHGDWPWLSFFWCCLHIVTASSSCTQVDFFEACSLSSLSRSLWMMRCAAPAGEMSRRMFSITLCG